jgi:hypothetical protein
MKTFLATLTLAALVISALPGRPADSSASADELIRQLSGTWKQNEAKRKIGSGLNLRFRSTAAGQLEELRGPDSRPVIQPVNFNGKPHTDGEFTIVWKQTGPNTYERTLSTKGSVLTTRRIRLSSDGQSLTEEFETRQQNGKTTTRVGEYRRNSGERKGLNGTWKVISIRNSEPPVFKYVASGKTALQVSAPLGQNYVLSLDGKPSPISGATVIPDMMISARVIDGNTLETTTTRQGVPASRSRIQLSEGGRVMTVTTTNLGPNSGGEPSVFVYEKQ